MARCAFCLHPILNPRAPDVLRVRLDNGRFGMVEMYWHIGRTECMAMDPLHLELADALDARGNHRGPDTLESATRVFKCYLAIRDRVAANVANPDRLRETIAVLRDTTHRGLTLRGPGLHWGRNCRVEKTPSRATRAHTKERS